MTPNAIIAICAVLSLVVGLGSGWIGAFMGMRIAVVRVEMRQGTAEIAINRITSDVSAHRDDLLVHDMEIGELSKVAGLDRVRRQILR